MASGWDEDALAMLKDSYREVTGRDLPEGMDPAVATEELRRQFAAMLGSPVEEEEEEATPLMLFSVILAAAKLKKAMLRGRRRRMREKQRRENEAHAAAHGWDPEHLEMLKASYLEVTGREMPAYYAPFQAVEELRRLVPNVGAPDDSPQDTVVVILAAAKLKRRWLEGRRRKLAQKASQKGVPLNEYTGPALEAIDWGGRVKEAPAWQVAQEEAAERRRETERQQTCRNSLALPSARDGGVFRPTEVEDEYTSNGRKVYEGWLHKKKRSLLKSDKHRWFVLHDGGELHYFPDATSLDQKIGTILLKGAGIKDGDTLASFVITRAARMTDEGSAGPTKDWFLEAGTNSVASVWQKHLKSVIAKVS